MMFVTTHPKNYDYACSSINNGFSLVEYRVQYTIYFKISLGYL